MKSRIRRKKKDLQQIQSQSLFSSPQLPENNIPLHDRSLNNNKINHKVQLKNAENGFNFGTISISRKEDPQITEQQNQNSEVRSSTSPVRSYIQNQVISRQDDRMSNNVIQNSRLTNIDQIQLASNNDYIQRGIFDLFSKNSRSNRFCLNKASRKTNTQKSNKNSGHLPSLSKG